MTVLVRKKYRVADLVETCATGRHKSGSADLSVLERYYLPLMNDELDDDAILEYGTHLVPNSVKFAGAWLDAVEKLIARSPHMRTRVRMRPRMSLEALKTESREVSVLLREFMREISEDLRAHFPPDSSVNERLASLVLQLDQAA